MTSVNRWLFPYALNSRIMHSNNLHKLKIQLQSYGSLRPEAWALLLSQLQFIEVKKGESFHRKLGALTWLSSGIFKEYNTFSRKKPAIINFLVPGDCLITRKLNARYYLKACIDSELYQLDVEELLQLNQKYPELRQIYYALCAQYDEGHEFRQLLLEEKSAAEKIKLMINRYRQQLNFIARRDLCNYLHLNYDYFCSLYAKLL
jgi:CRP-like cAMP-binding protein